MINEIGETAGRVWQYLNEHSPSTPREINRSLKLDQVMLYMAIGWLAREEKLIFAGAANAPKISLAGR